MVAKLYNTNPQGFPGYRNLDCPLYASCLDQAVNQSWPTFSCQHCFLQNFRQPLRAENIEMEAPGWVDIWSQAEWEG